MISIYNFNRYLCVLYSLLDIEIKRDFTQAIYGSKYYQQFSTISFQ